MNTIKCPECQSENKLDDEVCRNCGAQLPAEAPRPADTDWLSDLSDMIASVQSNEEEALAPEGLPDWLEADQAEQEEMRGEDEGDDLLVWLREIRPMGVAGDDEATEDEDVPEWLDRATGSLQKDASKPLEEVSDDTEGKEVEPRLREKGQSAPPEAPNEPMPEWVSALASSEEWPDTVGEDAVVDWFAHQEEEEEKTEGSSEELPMTRPLNSTKELRGVPRQIASDSLPEWLSDQIEEVPDESDIVAGERDQATGLTEVAESAPAKGLDLGAEDKQLDEAPGLTTSAEEQPSVLSRSPREEWLALLEDAPTSDGERELATVADSSPDAMQVHDGDIPEWLLALKPGISSETAGSVTTMPEESSGPLAGLRGVIPVAPVIAGNAKDLQASQYVESKERQRQVALLQQLAAVDSRPDDEAGVQSSGAMFAMARIFVGAALLIFAVVGWLLPSLGLALPLPAPAEVPDAAREAYGTLNNARGQTTLVAFEYTPALAGELDAVAGTLLRHLADNGSPVITVSQSAAGSAVAERAVAQIEGLENYSLGFVAGEAIGLRQLAECLADSGTCEMLSSRSVDEAVQIGLEDVRLIVVLAGERDGLSNWIEQVGSQSESAMVAGVAQQLGPVTAPYQASDQLSGYLNGLPAAAAYEQKLRGNEEFAAEWLTSLTLVNWLAIAVLVVGSLYFGLLGLAATGVRKAGI